LGAGRIASDYVKAMSVTDGAIASAIAARSPQSATEFARAHSMNDATVHATYSDLFADPNVDVVYIGTIADAHYELARESLESNKATVVEKPMGLSLGEVEGLVEVARDRNVFLMEGMWTRCFPAIHKLRQLVASSEVGPIIYASGDFGWAFPVDQPDDRIWLPESGGVTLDIGMYIAQLGRIAFPNGTLRDVTATGTIKNGVDYTVSAAVRYDRPNDEDVGDGVLQMTLTGAANTEERCVLQGTKGRIILDGPSHVPQRLRVVRDAGREGDAEEVVYDYPLPEDPYGEWNFPGSIGFVHQIGEVGRAVREGRVECESFTWEDSLEVARIIDGILGQVRCGKKER